MTDTAAFKETAAEISLHGLGFVQVKLEGKQRLHVWHPDLPRRECYRYSQIHDHRFGFTSRVLVGAQINILYSALSCSMPLQEIDATHIAYLHEGDRTKFGNRPWVPDGKFYVSVITQEMILAGDSYRMLPFVCHATLPGGDGRVATLMTKTAEHDRGAHSLCEIGITPDENFDRFQWSDADLWRVVADVLGNHD